MLVWKDIEILYLVNYIFILVIIKFYDWINIAGMFYIRSKNPYQFRYLRINTIYILVFFIFSILVSIILEVWSLLVKIDMY